MFMNFLIVHTLLRAGRKIDRVGENECRELARAGDVRGSTYLTDPLEFCPIIYLQNIQTLI